MASLKRSDRINAVDSEGGLPGDLAFIAMALQQLGRHEEAKDSLERLRGLMKTEKWASDDEAQSFLREAEDLIAEASEPTNAAEERPLP